MISRFFIDRPIFASVIAILITLCGLVALRNLPIEQYPNITPPQILVQATYPGASAETVADTVAAPLEQQINGVENMIYMFSENASNGNMTLNVFFDIGTNVDQAQINVQNQVNLAVSELPAEVQRQGLTIKKVSPAFLLVIAVQSPGDRYDDIFLSNYTELNIVDEIKRIKGVSDVRIITNRRYAMRVWMKPDRMAQLGVTTSDIVLAIRDQNEQFPIGQLGQEPTDKPVVLTLPIVTKGRLADPKEFENIIIRANPDGSMIQIKDIGSVELGAEGYEVNGFLAEKGEGNTGKPTMIVGVLQQYGANALQVAEEVRQTMKEIAKNFPEGVAYSIPYDVTLFVDASIKEVYKTIIEAGILVVLVVFVFLQNIRATLVPVLAMVVSIIGTFAGMYMFGFSINSLTLFGLVLAIGTVVDDAIVVIENVERNMREHGLSPIDAARRAMDEVTGPVIAIVFVLCAVFIPVAFLGGIAGQLYKQFAITISFSVVLSGIMALTLSPAIAAVLLKHSYSESRFGRWFNRIFHKFTMFYISKAKWLVERPLTGFLLFGIALLFLYFLVKTVPTGFVPQEDQGYFMVLGNLPDGASLKRTDVVSHEIMADGLENPAVSRVVSFSGYSLLESTNLPNRSSNFVVLKDWEERKSSESVDNVIAELNKSFNTITEAQILTFNPPAIRGLSTVGGFEFWIQNRGKGNLDVLQNAATNFISKTKSHPAIGYATSSLDANSKQFYLDLDREKAKALGVPIASVFETVQSLFGTLYVNDFNKFGRTYKVIIEADAEYRSRPEDFENVYTRAANGTMVPLKALVSLKNSKGPTLVSRFNGFNATRLNGTVGRGYSSGQAMDALEQVAKETLPADMSYAWSGESFQEKATGGTSLTVMLGAIVVVFLILSALYERWSLPVAILLGVPFGLLGAFFAVWTQGMVNDIYFQIGLITIIALSAKNAILIVEFAVIKQSEGMTIIEAAIEAGRIRFRAILMTSLTFIFGVLPLVFSSGAGAASRHSVGTGVLGGMLAATFLGVFFIPLFYRAVEEWIHRRGKKHEKD